MLIMIINMQQFTKIFNEPTNLVNSAFFSTRIFGEKLVVIMPT